MQKQSSSETTPGAPEPTDPPGVAARSQDQRIIDAMVASCSEKTYTGTTISDIVARASISRTTFYKRFPGKRACFDAALDSCIGELQAAAGAAVAGADSPPEAVRRTSTALLELLAAKPALAQVLAAEAVSVDPAVVRRYRKLLIPALEGLWDAGGDMRGAHTSAGLAFGRVQLLILNQIAVGHPEGLPELQPEIVYLALAPFVGHDEAVRQSRPAGRDGLGAKRR